MALKPRNLAFVILMNDLKGKDATNEGAGVHYGLLELWSQSFLNHFLQARIDFAPCVSKVLKRFQSKN